VGVNFIITDFSAVQSGLEYILWHFKPPLFPRKVSTAKTGDGQWPVANIEEAMVKYFQPAGYLDCRIQAFGVNQTNPDLIFIEMDKKDFGSDRAFKLALTSTLKRIKQKLDGFPTLYLSGHGAHFLQPINCACSLDDIKEFQELVRPGDTSISNLFLRFASDYLSGNKRDKENYPSMRSCGLRIPGSLNAGCVDEGIDPEVRLLQRWDGHRPDFRLLVGPFHSYLQARKLERKRFDNNNNTKSFITGTTKPWIEKVIQNGLYDHRKDMISKVLYPYLITEKGLEYNSAYAIIEEWLIKCDAIRRLYPSWSAFRNRIRYYLNKTQQTRWRPPGIEKFKSTYPDVSSTLDLS
jgi:hypothetical protein